ncbi:MAG TPA: dCTP deaminase [Xanthobacteraceae bacterium]|nr:dCTP deaminase [Xanthobacteraceae bacterium]
MILAQAEIREAVAKGEIRFDPPLEENQWHEASVDLRLGFKFTKLAAKRGLKVSLAYGMSAIANAGLWKEKTLRREDELGKTETYTVESGEFILAQTYERIWVPRHLVAAVEGRSSYARAGLSMHLTAPWLQPGWNGLLTLEIFNSGPLTIELTPTIDRPCQLTFFQLTSEVPEEIAYGTRPTDAFQGQSSPIAKAK